MVTKTPKHLLFEHNCTSACGESCDGQGWYWMDASGNMQGPYCDAIEAETGRSHYRANDETI